MPSFAEVSADRIRPVTGAGKWHGYCYIPVRFFIEAHTQEATPR